MMPSIDKKIIQVSGIVKAYSSFLRQCRFSRDLGFLSVSTFVKKGEEKILKTFSQ